VVLLDSYLYQAYGNQLNGTNTVSPFQWVGRLGYYFDGDPSQYYIRTRHYSPALARWLSFDPLIYNGALNLYEYVGNSPLTRTDPTGLENFYVCGQIVGAGAGTERCCARTCGCNHYDIYGDESGLVVEGWGGGQPPVKGGGKVPSGPGWKCYPLKRATTAVIPIPSPAPIPPIVEGKKISWGPAKGKSCEDATAADILACLRGKPKRTGDPGIVENCQTDCFDAAEGCCMTGFRPATIIPTLPSSY
jgi:RHS repeat-associated protein